MKERIRIGVTKDDGFYFYFLDEKVPDVYDCVIGKPAFSKRRSQNEGGKMRKVSRPF